MTNTFMQRQITDQREWIQLDGNNGTTFLPDDVAGTGGLYLGESTDDEEVLEGFDDYYDGELQTVGVIKGYGARLSAPGYLDCTEWSVFETVEEAEEYLEEMYGDDEEEKEEGNDEEDC